MDETNTSSIPWYRTRKFWGVIYFLAFAFSTITFIQFLDRHGGSHTFSYSQINDWFGLSYGSTLLFLLGFNIMSSIGGFIGKVIYWLLIVILTYKTFQNVRVYIVYPIIFILLYLSGMYYSALLLSV